MIKTSNRKNLKELLEYTESLLLNNNYTKKQQKNINKTIEQGYAILNNNNSTDKEIVSIMTKIKISFINRSSFTILIIFSVSFIIAALTILVLFKAIKLN